MWENSQPELPTEYDTRVIKWAVKLFMYVDFYFMLNISFLS